MAFSYDISYTWYQFKRRGSKEFLQIFKCGIYICTSVRCKCNTNIMVKLCISLYCKILLQWFNNFVRKGGKRTIVAMTLVVAHPLILLSSSLWMWRFLCVEPRQNEVILMNKFLLVLFEATKTPGLYVILICRKTFVSYLSIFFIRIGLILF